MQARMKHPAMIVPEVMPALYALGGAVRKSDAVPQKTLLLVELRASQINGCSFCVDMHSRELRKIGETDDRLFGLAAWRESPFFTDAERAALDLTEATTRLADRGEAVSDEIWEEAARHYDEMALGVLVVDIAAINLWNRLNAATKQIARSHPT